MMTDNDTHQRLPQLPSVLQSGSPINMSSQSHYSQGMSPGYPKGPYGGQQIYAQRNLSHENLSSPQLFALVPHNPSFSNTSFPPMTSPVANTSSRPSSSRSTSFSKPPPIETPVKKKRGRPPKASSLTNKITTTMNISVNTSPLSNSPTAESNSNQMMKQGAPDFFTPLMRVSPSNPRTKKRRKTTAASPLSELRPQKQRSSSALATPTSLGYFPYTPGLISGKTLDNISSITQEQSQQEWNQRVPQKQHTTHQLYVSPNASQLNSSPKNSAQYVSPNNSFSEDSHNLLPAASFVTKNGPHKVIMPPTPQSASQESRAQGAREPSIAETAIKLEPMESDFSLTVDDLGKAVFSSDFFTSKNTVRHEPVQRNAPVRNGVSSTSKEPVHAQTPKREKTEEKPRLTHSNSVIGIEVQHSTWAALPHAEAMAPQQLQVQSSPKPNLLRRHNSDFSGVAASSILTLSSAPLGAISEHKAAPTAAAAADTLVVPQTPNFKENYLYSATGFTPTSASFNLTPQFNSLMYSMMNMNSPAAKKGLQFLMNQDIFMGSANSGQMLDSQSAPMGDLINMNEHSEMQAASGTPPASPHPSDAHPSDGDARSALKSIMHIRKQAMRDMDDSAPASLD